MKKLFVILLLSFGLSACSYVEKIADYKSGDDLVLLYSEKIGEVDGENRSFPIMQIYIKNGDDAPKKLAVIGALGEYPNDYILSADNNYLYVNLESKIVKLDLKSGEFTDVFVSDNNVVGMVFSPDYKDLFIYEIEKLEKGSTYYAYLLDLATGANKIVKQGEIDNYYSPVAWRPDNKILMRVAEGDFTKTVYFDLNTNEFTKKEYVFRWTSSDGLLIAADDVWIEDICNDMMGMGPSEYKVVDPVTDVVEGRIGEAGKLFYIVAFSQDNKSVLYYSLPQAKDRSECNAAEEYYVKDLDSGEISEVEDVVSLAKDWGVSNAILKLYHSHTANVGDSVMLGNLELLKIHNSQTHTEPLVVFY